MTNGNRSNNSDGSVVSTLTGSADLFIFAYSLKSRSLVSWSDNSRSVLGVSDRDLFADNNIFVRHSHPDDRLELLKNFENALKGLPVFRGTYRWIRPDDQKEVWLHVRAKLVERFKEKFFDGVILDLSNELSGNTRELTKVPNLNSILSAFSLMVFILDPNFKIVRINRPSYINFNFGDEHFKTANFKLNKNFLDCFTDNLQKNYYHNIFSALLEGASSLQRTRLVESEQIYSLEFTPIKTNNAISGILGIVSDVSEVVEIEKKLTDLKKAEGLSVLAAGVTHNFNNILQSILGQATLISSNLQNSNLIKKASELIIETVHKASELGRQLHKIENSNLTGTNLSLCIMAGANRVEGLFSDKIRLSINLGNQSKVVGRTEELVDAIEIVLRNAKEALGVDGGKIYIRSQEVFLKEMEIEDLHEGSYAKLTIKDSGHGMDEETKERCLEPFFSTRDTDEQSGISISGRGMGLSNAFSIIRKNGGSIEIQSKPELGTTLTFYLPILATQNFGALNKKIEKESLSKPQILVIDDDDLVLESIRSMIENIGYECVTSTSANVAIDILKKHTKTLKLILLDAIMPELSGPIVIRRIKKINSRIPIVGFSGAGNSMTQNMLDAGAIKILNKPIGPKQLESCLKEIFEESKSNGTLLTMPTSRRQNIVN